MLTHFKPRRRHRLPRPVLLGILSALVLFLLGAVVTFRLRACRSGFEPPPPPPPAAAPDTRTMPATFPPGTHMPDVRETRASDPVDLATFSPGRDLVYVDDPRVWWESDNDKQDTECDHSMHVNTEPPLRRLIEMVVQRGGKLEVHDAYRGEGIHNSRSLHKEGRAIDLTCDQFPLSELAKLCWVAGFDWVFYEKGRGGNGEHIHCSVGR